MVRIVTAGLLVMLLFPYLFVLKEIQLTQLNLSELPRVFINTLVQSLLSSGATIIFGFWGALGLNTLQQGKRGKFFEILCLIPAFLPTLFFVTAILQVVRPFPFGLTGIVFVHTLTYLGLVALFFQSIIQNKFKQLSEQAFIEGATPTFFVRKIIRSLKLETFMIFLFLFVQFFTSFSVPLLIGIKYLTIETLIYEKIRIYGSISNAVFISALESIFIMGLLLFYRSQKGVLESSKGKIYLLKNKIGILWILLPVGIFLAGSVSGALAGAYQLLEAKNIFLPIFPLILKSILLSLLAGGFLIVVLSLVAFSWKSKIFDKFLFSYIPLSTVLIGLSFLLVDLGLQKNFELDIKVVLAMIILFLPALYRFELKTKLEGLRSQIEIAELMGANYLLIFSKIIFPQVLSSIFFLAGLGAFWTIGDFAISQLIYGKNVTLALYIQSLVGSYRIELANLFVFLLLLLGLCIIALFNEMKNVFSPKY